ncbi:hypothetical protein [Marisediminicola sp. LYQ134]|uniref:hypothetical protein n=1 Tax=Marisediminicola sp. LYQ134 TaxID=3391061 RepID=UPI00398393B1
MNDTAIQAIVVATITGLLGLVGIYFTKKLRPLTSEEALFARLEKLTKEIYGDPDDEKKVGLIVRMEASERRDATKGRIIRQLVRQWPTGDVPRLDPSDLAELDEDTIPLDHPWRIKPARPTS